MEDFKIFTHDRSRSIGIVSPEGSWVCELSKDNHYYEPDEVVEHANLICEAFNVANKTGLTPSQLQSELEKAKELIKQFSDAIKSEEVIIQSNTEEESAGYFANRFTTFLEGSGNKTK